MQKAVKAKGFKGRQPAFKALEKMQSQPKYWIDRINGAWRAAAVAYIECGKALLDAKKNLKASDFKSMLNKLDFDESKAKKLQRIAGRTAFSSHVNSLPSGYTTLYELSQLDDTQLVKLIKKGDINPNLDREGAEELVERLKPKPEPKEPKAKAKFSREAEDLDPEDDPDDRELAPPKPAKGKGKTGTIITPPTKGGLEQNLDNLDGALESTHLWIELIEKQLGQDGNDPNLPDHMIEKINLTISELERIVKEYGE